MKSYDEYKQYLSDFLRENKEYPRSIYIEVHADCNMRCVMCPCYIPGESVLDDREKKEMDFDSFKSFIDKINGKFNFQICFTYSGEPLLNKNISQMISYLKHCGIPSVIHSNGMALTDKKSQQLIKAGLDRLIISLDGARKESYELIRVGGKFDRVIENVRNFIRIRNEMNDNKPYVEMQMIVTSQNENEKEEFTELCKSLGVDCGYLKSLMVFKDTANEEFVDNVSTFYSDDEVRRYDLIDGQLVLRGQSGNVATCPEIQNAVITSDGDTASCCFDVHAKNSFGNVVRESLQEIWDKPDYQSFRQSVMNGRKMKMCESCNTEVAVAERVL